MYMKILLKFKKIFVQSIKLFNGMEPTHTLMKKRQKSNITCSFLNILNL